MIYVKKKKTIFIVPLTGAVGVVVLESHPRETPARKLQSVCLDSEVDSGRRCDIRTGIRVKEKWG